MPGTTSIDGLFSGLDTTAIVDSLIQAERGQVTLLELEKTEKTNIVSTLQAFQGSRVLAFRDRNFNCMGDEVFCTDPATGKTVWKFKLEGDLKKLGGFLAAPPVAAGDQVFLGTLRGEVLQIDPASGKVVKTYQTGSPIRYQPVVDGGRIYVGTQDGRLVCVDTGNKEFTGWSMWGGNAARTGIQETVQ